MIETKSDFESFCGKNWNQINEYIDSCYNGRPRPFYSSVDIREGRQKIVPVDNNLYPAGFNNVCSLDLLVCRDRFKKLIHRLKDQCQSIAVVVESHTKNLFYLDHLVALKNALSSSAKSVDLVSFDQSLFAEGDQLKLISQSKQEVVIQKAELDENYDLRWDFLVLNNDQSSPIGIPWEKLRTPVYPSPFMGWTRRKKSGHFNSYKDVVKEFSQKFDIKPQILQADFKVVHDVDFFEKKNLTALAEAVDAIKNGLDPQDKDSAKIYLKADQGTYGMGISVVSSSEEVLAMNRKTRNKMDVGKNHLKFTSVLVQEGIDTVVLYDGGPAEISIYLIDGKSVGGFVRANPLKDTQGNLNSRGMVYQKFCISEIRENSDHKEKEAAYSVVAMLSSLASAKEIEEIGGP